MWEPMLGVVVRVNMSLLNGEKCDDLRAIDFPVGSADSVPFFDFEISEKSAFDGAKRVVRSLRTHWSPADVVFSVRVLLRSPIYFKGETPGRRDPSLICKTVTVAQT